MGALRLRQIQSQIDQQIQLLERAITVLASDLDELERDLLFFQDSTPAYQEIRLEHAALAREMELIKSRINLLRFKRNLFEPD